MFHTITKPFKANQVEASWNLHFVLYDNILDQTKWKLNYRRVRFKSCLLRFAAFTGVKICTMVFRIVMSSCDLTNIVFKKLEAVDFPQTLCWYKTNVHSSNSHSKWILIEWFLQSIKFPVLLCHLLQHYLCGPWSALLWQMVTASHDWFLCLPFLFAHYFVSPWITIWKT